MNHFITQPQCNPHDGNRLHSPSSRLPSLNVYGMLYIVLLMSMLALSKIMFLDLDTFYRNMLAEENMHINFQNSVKRINETKPVFKNPDIEKIYTLPMFKKILPSNTKEFVIDRKYEFEIVEADTSSSSQAPQIVWLMSYPNSGTSYTMRLVSRVGNKSVATNYGPECDVNKEGRLETVPSSSQISLSKTSSSSNGGPFILSPKKSLPSKYILTKTHCGGRCTNCGPKAYIETRESFLEKCTRGTNTTRHHSMEDIKKERKGEKTSRSYVYYDPSIVKKAIHLIRNPFDNTVSNFHLAHHKYEKSGDMELLQRYPSNREGFRSWCHNLDAKFTEEEQVSKHISVSILKLFQEIPCHNSFYLFAQWHNLSIRAIEDLKLKSLKIYYEDYNTKFDKTYDRIFKFLHLDPVGPTPEFIGGKQYIEYFTDSERKAVKTLVHKMSDFKTWKLVERYFED